MSWFFVIPWTIACQALLLRGFSRPEHCRGLPCPSPGDRPNPGIKPRSPALQAASLQSDPPGKPNNTGVGSLSLLQGTFLTQEWNQASWIAGGFFTSWTTREAQHAAATWQILIQSLACKWKEHKVKVSFVIIPELKEIWIWGMMLRNCSSEPSLEV